MRLTKYSILALVLAAILAPTPALAGSWLLGFSPADTLPAGAFSAIAGTGGQITSVGDPRSTSFTPFLAHAGFRAGLADSWDIGYRLATVALPYSSVGPSLGSEFDVKRRLTAQDATWQTALVAGIGYAYLEIQDHTRQAWSPGIDLIISRAVTPLYTVFADLRYVYTAISTATGGSSANNFQAMGSGIGVKIKLTDMVSLIPEVGMFDVQGKLTGKTENGFGAQYGVVLGFRF